MLTYKFSLFLLLLILPYFAQCACPTIITRSEWNARAPKSSRPLRQNPAPFVVVHHTDTPTCSDLNSCKSRVKGIQNYHMDHNGWEDIGYSFLIGGDGNVYEGRGWGKHGSHVPKYNSKSIGISLIGNFMNAQPPQAQLDTLEKLISCGVENNHISSSYQLVGHRQGSRTSCPGNKLYNEIQTWPNFANSIPVV